jgi:thiamine kinase-like enzyme
MSEIRLNKKSKTLEINEYDGIQGEAYSSNLRESLPLDKVNFFRNYNNHAYTQGNIIYEGDCENNIIISPYNNKITNVKNAFIIVNKENIEICPINNLKDVLVKGREVLSKKNIEYHLPKLVFNKENIEKKSLEELKSILIENYGLKIIKSSLIESKNKLGGTYYLEDNDKNKYVFKSRSGSKEYLETISKLMNKIPGFFPKVYSRLGDNGSITKDNGNIYMLESFIEGEERQRDSNYFSDLGKLIGSLHNEFILILSNNENLFKNIKSRKGILSESNLASSYLDLSVKMNKNIFLMSELEKLVDRKFIFNVNKLPSYLIHGDLNTSNIIWDGKKAKIIDSDSIKLSKRVLDFVPALVLKGNKDRPDYVSGSLESLINYYNDSCISRLSEEELSILPSLLKYSLIKYYTIRSIKRNIKDELYSKNLEKEINEINKLTF